MKRKRRFACSINNCFPIFLKSEYRIYQTKHQRRNQNGIPPRLDIKICGKPIVYQWDLPQTTMKKNISFTLLSAEVIVHDRFRIYTETVEHADHSLRHRAGTAHVIFDILRRIVVFQISLIHHVMHKARSVLHACCVCGRIRTVQSQMEMEIREILFQS